MCVFVSLKEKDITERKILWIKVKFKIHTSVQYSEELKSCVRMNQAKMLEGTGESFCQTILVVFAQSWDPEVYLESDSI